MTQTPWKTLCSSWRTLTDWLWPPTPEQEERDYQARLTQELHVRQLLMVGLCQRIERWRDRLEQLQRHEVRLAHQIQAHADQGQEEQTRRSTKALERVRRVQLRLRERLQRTEKKYQQAQLRFEQLKQERQRRMTNDQ